jgi:hypothetical protein
MLCDMTTSKRKQALISVTWTRDESRNWEDDILQAFELLLGDDPLPPVDKPVDVVPQNSHHEDN